MRIAAFEVSGLFGIFNHRVDLHQEERVTIIHGPNGFGKTVMLRLLAAVFGRRYAVLRSTPFERFAVHFTSGRSLVVTKQGPGEPGTLARTPTLVFVEEADGESVNRCEIRPQAARRLASALNAIEHEIPDLERVSARLWEYAPTGELLTYEDVVERFSFVWPNQTPRDVADDSQWLQEIQQAVPVHFVEAQRLLVAPPRPSTEARGGLQPAVSVYAEELAKTIQAKLADYANLSQSLDRSFPFRVVQAKADVALPADLLKAELAKLEVRRAELRGAGLLDTEGDIVLPVVGDVDEEKRALLDVYVKDSVQKLRVFDDVARKTELMKRILNSRYLYKRVDINREDGIQLQTRDGRTLSLGSLSSGEQHELVLLYELLFRVTEGSLILLDEPELSLHVEWQSAFLDDLTEIANLRFLDVIVATHSPQVIGDRWSLTVELHGPG